MPSHLFFHCMHYVCWRLMPNCSFQGCNATDAFNMRGILWRILPFNTKKSKLLVFGKKSLDFAPLLLNNESIEVVSEWKYLGCTLISNKGKLTFSNRSELCSFYGSSNSILRAVCRPNELVLMKLLYSVCVPSLTYCAEVKDLSSSDMHACNVALNNSIRHIFSYNRWESTRHLRQP